MCTPELGLQHQNALVGFGSFSTNRSWLGLAREIRYGNLDTSRGFMCDVYHKYLCAPSHVVIEYCVPLGLSKRSSVFI